MAGKKVEVTFSKTTKLNKKFVYAGNKMTVTEEEKKKLEKAGLIVVKDSEKVSQSQTEIRTLKEELAASREEVSTLKEELAALSGNDDLLGDKE